MREEHLQSCLATANIEERMEMSNWYHVVDIIQTAFWGERSPTECEWKTVVLIPKGNREFGGIGLFGVIRK